MNTKKAYLLLLFFTLIWSFLVISLGAYTRLTDAGLGCPDWPGCYGFLTVPQSTTEIEQALKAYPNAPFETQKAWNEMLHRYVAGFLGLLIGAIGLIAWKSKTKKKMIPTLLVALVIFQALLGMWTVTLNLMPVVVMGHLLGGFTIVALLLGLIWQETRRYTSSITPSLTGSFSQSKPVSFPRISTKTVPRSLKWFCLVCLLVVGGQIMLGGWVSANYAALVCTELPFCEANWQQLYDAKAFDPFMSGHASYEYGVLNFDQRVTIHVTHRLGALLVSVFILLLSFWIKPYLGAGFTKALLGLLAVQISLGLANVVLMLPLTVALLHHFFALLLFLTTFLTTLRLWNLPEANIAFSTKKLQEVSHGKNA